MKREMRYEGEKKAKCFGRMASMGIPDYDREPDVANGAPEKNKFSWMEMSQSEVMSAVKGRGTSHMSNRKNSIS